MQAETSAIPAVQLVRTPDGVTVAVQEWGNPDGPEILFIHGIAQSHLSFTRQFRGELAAYHRIVAYDVRGHGASDKPLDPVYYQSAGRWADEVQAVIDAKRLHRPVLVGWSMGGRILGQYLAVHGDRRLGGLNFVATRAVSEPRFSGMPALNLPVAGPRDLAGRIDVTAAFLRACFRKQPDEREFAIALAYNMITPPEVRAAIRAWPTDIPATIAALQAVRVPTLVTHGRDDAVVLPAAAERTASLVPGARISWYDECGHSPFFEDSPRFNRELAAFSLAAWNGGKP